MKTASADAIAKINSFSRHFELRLTAGNTVLDLFYRKATFVSGSCGGGEFAVGCSFASSLEVDANYDPSILAGTEVLAEIGVQLDDESIEYIPMGYYTIQKPTKERDLMTFTAVDRMLSVFNRPYITNLTYPATIADVIDEIETDTGITVNLMPSIGSQTIAKLGSVTVRDAVQTIATLALGYAYFNADGECVIDNYTRSSDILELDYDLVKTFPKMDEEPSLIEGVSVRVTEDTEDDEGTVTPGIVYTYGTGNTVEVYCPYMTQSIFDAVKTSLVGLSYCGGHIEFMGNPLLEPPDKIRFKGDSDRTFYELITEHPKDIVTSGSDKLVAYDFTVFLMPCMEIRQEFDGGLLTQITAPGCFEVDMETTQPGVFTQFMDSQMIENASSRALIATAKEAARQAQQSADDAQDSADQAQASADDATRYANGALAQLGVVEDVVGTLNWISSHGTYALTTDTEVEPGKYYFTRSGNTYTIVLNPTGNPSSQGYYELTGVDEAVTNYVATHLALTSSGLYVLMDNSGYKVRITSSSVAIVDPNGNDVAVYGATAVIGRTDGSTGYFETAADALNGYSKNGDPYFIAGDLAGKTTVIAYVSNGEITYDVFELDTSVTPTVTVGGTSVPITAYTADDVTLASSPQTGSVVEITYKVKATITVPYFTFGTRSGTNGAYSVVAGQGCEASATRSYAEGKETKAIGENTHAEGSGSSARGLNSHAEGSYSHANGYHSHAEGTSTYAEGFSSHAEGHATHANGDYSHAEGEETEAYGDFSHSSGYHTVAYGDAQTVVGAYNDPNTDDLFQVGNGTNDNNRSNAFSVDKYGDTKIAGDLTVGGTLYGALPIKESWDDSSISVSSGSWSGMINSQAFQLDAGVYLAIYHVDFSSNATGYRMAQINTTTTGGSGNRYTAMSTAISGNNTRIQGTQLLTPSSTTNYGLYVYQNSGTNLTVAASVRIIKIG